MSTYMDPAIAAAYDKHYQRPVDLAEDAAIDRVLSDLDGCDVLDLGCGTCPLLDRHEPGHYYGVDISLSMLAQARRKHDKLRRGRAWRALLGDASDDPSTWAWTSLPQRFLDASHQAEALALPFSFDAVVSLFAFSYFPDAFRALHSAAYLLRPGGRAVIQAYTHRYARRKHCMDSDPFTTYTPTSLSMVAADAGLIPIRVIPLGWLPDPVANLLPPRLGARLQVGRRWTPTPYSLLLEARKPYAMTPPVTTR